MPHKWKEDKKKYQRNYHADWYAKNKEEQKRKQFDRKQEIKKWFSDYKSKLKCNRCIENHPATLDFHHIGNKNKAIHLLVSQGSSKERILKEISLCEVLCSNCHRKEHWSERGKKTTN